MKRFDPIPLIHPGGIQPFAKEGGQEQGAALLAMLRGATFSGMNPQDPWRAMQASANGPTVLSLLADGTPGSGRGWEISPDNADRIRDWERRSRTWESPQEEQRAQRHASSKQLPWKASAIPGRMRRRV